MPVARLLLAEPCRLREKNLAWSDIFEEIPVSVLGLSLGTHVAPSLSRHEGAWRRRCVRSAHTLAACGAHPMDSNIGKHS